MHVPSGVIYSLNFASQLHAAARSDRAAHSRGTRRLHIAGSGDRAGRENRTARYIHAALRSYGQSAFHSCRPCRLRIAVRAANSKRAAT